MLRLASLCGKLLPSPVKTLVFWLLLDGDKVLIEGAIKIVCEGYKVQIPLWTGNTGAVSERSERP